MKNLKKFLLAFFLLAFFTVSVFADIEIIPEPQRPEKEEMTQIEINTMPTTDTSIDLYKVNKNKIMLFDKPNIVIGDNAPSSDVIAAIEITTNIQNVKNIQLSAAKLANEIIEITNMISIGNPCDNPLTKKISGINSCTMNLKDGQGFIGFYNYNGYVQAVIAGYSTFETRMATRAFNQALHSDGDFFIVEGDNLNNFRIRKISSLSYDFESIYNEERYEITQEKEIILPQQQHEIQEYTEYEDSLSPPGFPDENTITLQLKKGWNLVSLPGRLIKFVDNFCTKKPVGFVYLKDDKKYVSLKDASRILGNFFNTYLSQNAFWIYSYDNCEQKVVIENFDRKIVLSSGWNLLPNTKLKCSFEQQFWWNPNIQEWQSHVFGLPHEGMIVRSVNICEE
jgi:hypothetical protein